MLILGLATAAIGMAAPQDVELARLSRRTLALAHTCESRLHEPDLVACNRYRVALVGYLRLRAEKAGWCADREEAAVLKWKAGLKAERPGSGCSPDMSSDAVLLRARELNPSLGLPPVNVGHLAAGEH